MPLSRNSFSPSGESVTILLTRIKNRFHSLQWKFIAAYLILLLIAFFVIVLSVFQLVGNYMFNQRMNEKAHMLDQLSGQLEPLMDNYDAASIYSLAASAVDKSHTRLLITDVYGTVQLDTENLLNGTEMSISQVASALSGQKDSAYYQSELAQYVFSASETYENGITGIAAAPIGPAEHVRGAVLYLWSAQEIYDGLIAVMKSILVILVTLFAVVGVITVIMTRVFTYPVKELSNGIQQMSNGDFTTRVLVRGKNEFSELAQAFNTMSEKLEALDRSRNQFVSNASHELKTPLASMKILLQSIMYQEFGDAKMTREFLSDIDKEIDRLSNVVSDLLSLVGMDSDGIRLDLVPLSLGTLIGDNVKRLNPLACECGIDMDSSLPDGVEVLGDASKLTQAFYNLIDNAIKYTPRGGNVQVKLTKQGKTAIVRVIDNGIGIPEKDQLHIFDRFYRVDRARSRETGGTGLGLSIVKQIVLLHNGTITVSSVEEKGTTFTVKLPLATKQQGGKSA